MNLWSQILAKNTLKVEALVLKQTRLVGETSENSHFFNWKTETKHLWPPMKYWLANSDP